MKREDLNAHILLDMYKTVYACDDPKYDGFIFEGDKFSCEDDDFSYALVMLSSIAGKVDDINGEYRGVCTDRINGIRESALDTIKEMIDKTNIICKEKGDGIRLKATLWACRYACRLHNKECELYSYVIQDKPLYFDEVYPHILSWVYDYKKTIRLTVDAEFMGMLLDNYLEERNV